MPNFSGIKTWWKAKTTRESVMSKQLYGLIKRFDELELATGQLFNEHDALLQSKDKKHLVVNAKLEIKLWKNYGFEARKYAYSQGYRAPASDASKPIKERFARITRGIFEFERMNEQIRECLDQYASKHDTEYEMRTFSFSLLTDGEAKAFLKRVADVGGPPDLDVKEVTFDVEVGLRASSKVELDMVHEWDGIDKFLAAGRLDIKPHRQRIRDALDAYVEAIAPTDVDVDEVDDEEEEISHSSSSTYDMAVPLDPRFDLGLAIQTCLNDAEADVRATLMDVVGSTYLVKKGAKVHRRVRLKRATVNVLSGGFAITRLVLTCGADPTAWIQLTRSVISLSSAAWKELRNDIDSMREKVNQDLADMTERMQSGALKTFNWKKAGDVAIRAATGWRTSVLGGNLQAWNENKRLYADKLDTFRQRVASDSLALQTLLKEARTKLAEAEASVRKKVVGHLTDLLDKWSDLQRKIVRLGELDMRLYMSVGNAILTYKMVLATAEKLDIDVTVNWTDAITPINTSISSFNVYAQIASEPKFQALMLSLGGEVVDWIVSLA